MSTTEHDTHLYDPDRHDNQIVAVFEDRQAAERARDALVADGVADSSVQVIDRVDAPTAPVHEETVGDQILSAFMSLFTPAHEHEDYAHAVGRGHAMVVVTPQDGADRHHIVELLERAGPIDFDAKLEEWRQAGYEGAEPKPAGERREGQREATAGSARVRSYLSDRA